MRSLHSNKYLLRDDVRPMTSDDQSRKRLAVIIQFKNNHEGEI